MDEFWRTFGVTIGLGLSGLLAWVGIELWTFAGNRERQAYERGRSDERSESLVRTANRIIDSRNEVIDRRKGTRFSLDGSPPPGESVQERIESDP